MLHRHIRTSPKGIGIDIFISIEGNPIPCYKKKMKRKKNEKNEKNDRCEDRKQDLIRKFVKDT